MKRENGFYWVKINLEDDWTVAEFEDGDWYRPGIENIYTDNSIELISETKLLPPKEK